MKQKLAFLTLFLIFVVAACGTKEEDRSNNENYNSVEEEVVVDEDSNVIEETESDLKKLELMKRNGEYVFLVEKLFQLIEGEFVFDDLHRTLTMKIDDQIFKLVYGVPVVEHNGLYLATDEIMIILEEEDVYLPIPFLERALGLPLDVKGDLVTFQWESKALPTSTAPIGNIIDQSWSVEEMVDYLSFLEKPIKDAVVSTISNHLPGAKRAYRNGYHEGIDWYGYATGQHISTDTPIYAMADGVVVRADHDYEEYLSPLIRNKDLTLTSQLGETPEYIFDRLRGRQVWVQYENGVMNRFAHLDSIPEDLNVGDRVSSETIIGYVGNSGTSGAVNEDGSELHLHQDLLIYGELFWKPFSLEEVKEILIEIFGE